MTRSWAHLIGVVLLVGAIAGCSRKETAPPAAASGPSASAAALEPLIQQFAKIERPDDDEAGGLRDVSAAGFQKEIDVRRQLRAQVQQLGKDGLSLEEDIDRRLMIGLLESSIHTAEARRIWENDPALYVPASEIGRGLEPTAPGTPQERATSLTAVLTEVPARLDHARRNLKTPSRSFTESALFKTEGTIKLLRDSAPTLASQAADAKDALTAATKTALASLEDYLKYLKTDLLPRSTGSWVLGKENYDYVLQHRWMMNADADAILARGQQAFQQTEALAQQVAQRIQPGAKHWTEVYEKIKNDHPSADGIKQAYQTKIDAAKAFVIEHRIVTLPAGESVITIDTPPAMRRSSPFGTFQSVDAFGKDLQGKLVLTPIEDWMTAQQREDRLRSHHTAWIPIIAVHEAYPGHHVRRLGPVHRRDDVRTGVPAGRRCSTHSIAQSSVACGSRDSGCELAYRPHVVRRRGDVSCREGAVRSLRGRARCRHVHRAADVRARLLDRHAGDRTDPRRLHQAVRRAESAERVL